MRAIGLIIVLLAMVVPASAQQACGNRDALIANLVKKYHEMPIGRGISTGSYNMIEIYTSPAGTWTVMITTPQGLSCFVQAGTDWQVLVKPIPGEPS